VLARVAATLVPYEVVIESCVSKGACSDQPIFEICLRKTGYKTMVIGSVATVKTSTFEKCVITGAINYVKS
jgi:hypothetical protein